MLMTKDELAGCMKLLRSYWPGEWDEARYAVWLEAFKDLSAVEAQAGLVALGRTAKFPTVAEFLQLVRENASGVIRGQRGMFLPGTGWVNEYKPRRALPGETTSPEQVVIHIAEARARLRRAKEAG